MMSSSLKMVYIAPCFNTPTKRLNAQNLVEYYIQLLYEENQKSGNVMQQPMDSCACGIYTSSESILIWSYLLFTQ